MKTTTDDQKDSETCLDGLEDPIIVLDELKEKELLSTVMSSYYLLYR